jgi:hypothetical protein
MTDRALLFLASLIVMIGALGVCNPRWWWLGAFGIYRRFPIGQAVETAAASCPGREGPA